MINFLSFYPPYMIHTVLVAFRYRMMVFTAFMCCQEEFLANKLKTNVAKTMSGLVFTSENISDPVMLWYRSCSAWLASGPLFGKSRPSFIGVLYCLAKSKWYFLRILSM